MWAVLLLIAIPPPSDATLAQYQGAKYPQYVFRVWTADWCKTCNSVEWKKKMAKLDAIPGVGVQFADYDRFRAFARRRGVTALPTVELYRVESGRLRTVVGRRVGAGSFEAFEKMIPP